MAGLLSNPLFRFIGEPYSLLINGKGCSDEPCSKMQNDTFYEPDVSIIRASLGQTIRLRLINAASLSHLRFTIPDVEMTIFEIEGSYIKPVSVKYLDIASGQRYSIMIKPLIAKNYTIFTRPIWRKGGPKYGKAILCITDGGKQIESVEMNEENLIPSSFFDQEEAGWILSQFESSDTLYKLPDPTRTLILRNEQQRVDNHLKWTLNDISFVLPSKSILQHVYDGTLHTLPRESQPFLFSKGDVIDIILVNLAGPNGQCETHPWHLRTYTSF